MLRKIVMATLLFASFAGGSKAEDGYDLWLRYKKCDQPELLTSYRNYFTGIYRVGNHASLDAAVSEMTRGLSGILDKNITLLKSPHEGAVIIGTITELSPVLRNLIPALKIPALPEKKEGFLIFRLPYRQRGITIVTAESPVGVLYGSFHLLRLLQSQTPVVKLAANESPALDLRMLNHWDNLTRHVERGYAGIALWNWHTLPDYKDPRYTDYARANASLGINAVTVTNVNANALVLTKPYLEKLRALADIFRPYGIRLFLTARFSAPIELDKFKTAFQKSKGRLPTDEEITHKERNNIINFLRQKLQTCAIFCERKSRNIVASKGDVEYFALTQRSIPISYNLLLEDYDFYGYRKVSENEYRIAKAEASKLKTKEIKDSYGFKIISVSTYSEIPISLFTTNFDGPDSTASRKEVMEVKHSAFSPSVEDFVLEMEDDMYLSKYEKDFDSMESKSKKSMLKKFISDNLGNPRLKKEIRTARKILEQLNVV